MTTPWDRIEEEYRAYLTKAGYSADDFNEGSFSRAEVFNTFDAWQKQQQQQFYEAPPAGKRQKFHNFTVTTPWDRITDEDYKSWILEDITAKEYNGLGPVDRRTLRTQYQQQQQQQFYEAPPAGKRQKFHNFTVLLLDRYNEVTASCRFSGKEVPSTLQGFWLAIGFLNDQYEYARVTVDMANGWSKLDANPKSTAEYKIHPDDGVMFQLSPYRTPNSSPSADAVKKAGVQKREAQFKSVVEELFKKNPFAFGIPAVYEDKTIKDLRKFLHPVEQDDGTDRAVLALILAMPGSGKTRSVVEAASKSESMKYKRERMSNQEFDSSGSLKEFLEATVAAACGTSSIPLDHNKTVVVHLDEIQSLMFSPADSDKLLVTSLSETIDRMVNVDPPRSWLKFVLTGTNIFTRKTIRINTEVKVCPIALDGAFSIDFVKKLAEDYITPKDLFDQTNYLERCRHNRRFTELFFSAVWDGTEVADAYKEAFQRMKEQVSNQIGVGVSVSRVACSVFTKILTMTESEVNSGLVHLKNYTNDKEAYIAGGGLNMHVIDDNEISIYYPNGFVLEVLEALLGRAAPPATGKTVTAFLRVHSVCGFGVKGHLFEWLIAHDLSCPQSEFEKVMESYAPRHDSCIGAEVISDAQVYVRIFDANAVPGIWVVRDTHQNNQDRWVDVAYSIKVSDSYNVGFALIECKTGYEKTPHHLGGFYGDFCRKAVGLARKHPDTYFVAVFACEHKFKEQDLMITIPDNLITVIQVITNDSCPIISSFLGANPTDDDSNSALSQQLSRTIVSLDGAESYRGGSQGM